MLNVFVLFHTFGVDKPPFEFICDCMSDVMPVKNANLAFGTLFTFPFTIKSFPIVVVNVEILKLVSAVFVCNSVILLFVVVMLLFAVVKL